MLSEPIERAIARAVEHQQALRFDEAEGIYREILKQAPDDAVTLQLLGVLLGQTARHREAIELIERAIRIVPHVAEFHNNLANVLRDFGELARSVVAYRRAIEINPGFGQAYNNLGNALGDLGKFEEAIAAYSRCIELDAADAGVFCNLGIALQEFGDAARAIDAYRKAIELNPRSAIAYNNLGVVLQASGKLVEAIRAYKNAIDVQVDYPQAYNNLGGALCDNEQAYQAIEVYRRAIELKPDYPEGFSNLGTALKQAGRFEEAIVACRRAIQLRPDFAEAHCNMGVALAEGGHFQDAIAALRHAIELKPSYAEAHINLGVVLCNTGRNAEAISSCSKAIELDPKLEAARCNFAQVLLTLGDFDRGWTEYERRWNANPRIRANMFSESRWAGEPLGGKTILLHAEQGLGDAIQFVRYVPLVAERGGRVILECQPELVRLFQFVKGVEHVIPAGGRLPAFDLQCPLMSLPMVMRTTLNSVPAEVPYIHVKRRGKKVNDAPGLKVGLVWAGRPTHSNDRNRSMKLAEFGALASVRGVTFHTLQKGAAAAEALSPPTALELVDHSGELHDFIETAELILELDLIISVDSSVAHLAGALGKPVWVLLPFVADWRWMRDRQDTPWYPAMRLFRQKWWGSWEEPISQIVCALTELVAARTI